MNTEKRERLELLETQARRLARSGDYRNSMSIKMTMLAQGHADVPKIFTNRWTQCELDRLCEQASLQHDVKRPAQAA